jgi:PAS domain-containing protein
VGEHLERDVERAGAEPDDRRLEGLLSRAEVRRLRAVLDERDDALLSLNDATGHVLWATVPGALGIFGRELEQFRGQHASAFLHPDDQRAWERAFARACAGATVEWEGRVSTVDRGTSPSGS